MFFALKLREVEEHDFFKLYLFSETPQSVF